jgi:hypothetical protein
MAMFNTTQWAGNYTAANVAMIDMDVVNLGATTMNLRIAVQGTINQRYASTTSVTIPPDGQWRHVTFGLSSIDLSIVPGTSATLATVLSNVSEFRILSVASGPSWIGDLIAGTLGVDNIEAKAPVPTERTTWGLLKARFGPRLP